MVVRRVYRVSFGRGRRRGGVREGGLGVEDEGIGIGGFVVRFADCHECSVFHPFPVFTNVVCFWGLTLFCLRGLWVFGSCGGTLLMVVPCLGDG